MKHEILAQVDPERIDLLTKLVEAYDHLGIVSTLDHVSGKVLVRVTPDTWSEMIRILRHLPFPISLLGPPEVLGNGFDQDL